MVVPTTMGTETCVLTRPGVGDQGQMVAIEDRLTALCP
jgi:hypothetical protein